MNQTIRYGQTPFLQKAFTLSFINGDVLANNNLVGIGNQGNGFGSSIGYFDTYDMVLDVIHDNEGFYSFDIYQTDNHTIELYNPFNDTSYFLSGYHRDSFDYDLVFYDNIHYFYKNMRLGKNVIQVQQELTMTLTMKIIFNFYRRKQLKVSKFTRRSWLKCV